MRIYPKNTSLDDKIQYAVLLILRVSLVVAAAVAASFLQWELMFVSLWTLLLTYIPRLIERNYKVELPIEFEIVIVAFIYAALFLGEVMNFYDRFWWWDVMLHAASGIILAFAGFLVMYLLHYQGRLKTSPLLISLFAFCFALAAGALWEIFEYGIDQTFGTNMQKSGLDDTMKDLILDAGGALLVASGGYFYMKHGRRNWFFRRFVVSFLRNNPHLSRKRKSSERRRP